MLMVLTSRHSKYPAIPVYAALVLALVTLAPCPCVRAVMAAGLRQPGTAVSGRWRLPLLPPFSVLSAREAMDGSALVGAWRVDSCLGLP